MTAYATIELSRQLAALGCVATTGAEFLDRTERFHLYDFLAPTEQARKNCLIVFGDKNDPTPCATNILISVDESAAWELIAYESAV